MAHRETTGRNCFVLCSAATRQRVGTFFRFGYRRTRWGVLFTWVDALKPEPGDSTAAVHSWNFARSIFNALPP